MRAPIDVSTDTTPAVILQPCPSPGTLIIIDTAGREGLRIGDSWGEDLRYGPTNPDPIRVIVRPPDSIAWVSTLLLDVDQRGDTGIRFRGERARISEFSQELECGNALAFRFPPDPWERFRRGRA